MKKTSLFLTAFLSLALSVSAQKKGFMSKLKDKVNEVSEQAKQQEAVAHLAPLPNEKELKKDIESQELESKTINKDSRGLSGIYYSKDPLRVGFKGLKKFNFAQKFLINYIENADQKNIIEVSTRYNYDKSIELKPLAYTVASNSPKGFPVEAGLKNGHLYLDAIKDRSQGAEGYYHFLGRTSYNYRFNKSRAPEGETSWIFMGHEVIELEPGILVFGLLEEIFDANTPEKYEDLKKYASFFLMYKKEKEEVAKALTNEQVWDKLKAFYTPYRKAFKQVEQGNVEMVKPLTAFKDMPTNAELTEVAKAGFAQRSWREQLIYVYPATAWTNKFENVGIMGNTLTYRVMQIQVIMKEGDQCKITQFMIRQDNTYKAGSNAENFKGNPLIFYGDTDKTDVNCTKAMQYKK